jgi:hypothetical protein
MGEERDNKRFSGALALYAENASKREIEVWQELVKEFGYKWISTPVEVRQRMISAIIAASSREKGGAN